MVMIRNFVKGFIFALAIILSLTTLPTKTYQEGIPIEHIIIIMQENHSFDNYFGVFPGANGVPKDVCMKYEGYCIRPFLITTPVTPDMPHNWNSSHIAYDNGKMDKFIEAEGNIFTMAYYNNITIPYYWELAKNYVLCDNFFSSVLSFSQPNHWYSIAGQAPIISIFPGVSSSSSETLKDIYLNESNMIETIADLFMNSSISWKYYDYPITPGTYSQAIKSGQAFDFWNPYAAKMSSYTLRYASHFASRDQFFIDLRNGDLPEVSWIIPDFQLSEHPPANITLGMIWVAYIVDSIMTSKYWNSSVIIITWDDYGGFYDHVPPTQIDKYGLSFRVPALIISPYSKSGYIDHTLYYFESILKFIEWRFNLPSLTYRDKIANNLLNAFNFNQSPNPPHVIPLSYGEMMELKKYINITPLNLSLMSSTQLQTNASYNYYILILFATITVLALILTRKRN
jgi:phospholipase C